MKKISMLIVPFIVMLLSIQGVWGQEYSPLSIRIHVQPQMSSINPYEQGFIPTESQVSPTFAFGLEVTRNLSKNLEISLGYHHSTQVGTYEAKNCYEFLVNTYPDIDFSVVGGNFGQSCPVSRRNFEILKIPLSLGWRIIEKNNFMSRLSFGPQLHILLDRSYLRFHRFKKFSGAFMAEWSNYFKLSKSLSLVSGLRVDRSFTRMTNNNKRFADFANANTFGLVLGFEYTLWTEKK